MRFHPLIIAILVISICFVSCKQGNKTKTEVKKEFNLLPIHLFDSLEHFFGNENWLLEKGQDSSFLLFSRQTGNIINIYQYRIINGDSVNQTFSDIHFSNDTVVWNGPAGMMYLDKEEDNKLYWGKIGESASIIFEKSADGLIQWQQNGETVTLKRTITMSDFLVRSRYDFLHGTHYAFDTIKFSGKTDKDKERRMINLK